MYWSKADLGLHYCPIAPVLISCQRPPAQNHGANNPVKSSWEDLYCFTPILLTGCLGPITPLMANAVPRAMLPDPTPASCLQLQLQLLANSRQFCSGQNSELCQETARPCSPQPAHYVPLAWTVSSNLGAPWAPKYSPDLGTAATTPGTEDKQEHS